MRVERRAIRPDEVETAEDIRAVIRNDARTMGVLRAVRKLQLPDAWVVAGYIRNRIWNVLSGVVEPSSADIDVAFFDPANRAEWREKDLDERLGELLPGHPWSVKNEARMHLVNGDDVSGDEPYVSTADAIAHFPETATCIGAKLDGAGDVRIVAPHGVDDLLGMVVRPSPAFAQRLEYYRARVMRKRWHERWPKLRFIGLEDEET